jgi:hypothetical protein
MDDGTIRVFLKSFDSPQRLAATIVHEQVHQVEVRAGMKALPLTPGAEEVSIRAWLEREIRATSAELEFLKGLPGVIS